MGYVKEPDGIDFIVDTTPLTTEDRKKISEIIAYYKATGRKMPLRKAASVRSRKSRTGGITGTRKRVSV
jgi:hypothetical protein